MMPLLLALFGADFPVCTAPAGQFYPAVAYTGDRFYVFWLDQRHAPYESASVYAARVTRDGTVLDPNGIELFHGDAGYRCNAAFDGTNFLVVFRNHC